MTITRVTTYSAAVTEGNITKTLVVTNSSSPGPVTTISIVEKAAELASLQVTLANTAAQLAYIQSSHDVAAASIEQINAL